MFKFKLDWVITLTTQMIDYEIKNVQVQKYHVSISKYSNIAWNVIVYFCK